MRAFRFVLGVRCGYCLMIIQCSHLSPLHNSKMLSYWEFHLTLKCVRHRIRMTSQHLVSAPVTEIPGTEEEMVSKCLSDISHPSSHLVVTKLEQNSDLRLWSPRSGLLILLTVPLVSFQESQELRSAISTAKESKSSSNMGSRTFSVLWFCMVNSAKAWYQPCEPFFFFWPRKPELSIYHVP